MIFTPPKHTGEKMAQEPSVINAMHPECTLYLIKSQGQSYHKGAKISTARSVYPTTNCPIKPPLESYRQQRLSLGSKIMLEPKEGPQEYTLHAFAQYDAVSCMPYS